MPPRKVLFYHTRFCPRCQLVARELRRQQALWPELEVEEIEIGKNFRHAWREGIRCIPALRIGAETLSGLWLTPGRVREFLATTAAQE